jgi:hypothetical protein
LKKNLIKQMGLSEQRKRLLRTQEAAVAVAVQTAIGGAAALRGKLDVSKIRHTPKGVF